MDSALLKVDEEKARHAKRVKLRELNAAMDVQGESWHSFIPGGI
jgi:regulator of nonsense transcripts 2